MDKFGERLDLLKKEKKLTTQMVADHLGVQSRMVQYYLSGKKKPDYWGFLKLADLFDVSLDYLAGRSDER